MNLFTNNQHYPFMKTIPTKLIALALVPTAVLVCVGREVVIQATEAIALSVEKP